MKILYILKHNPWGIGGGCYVSRSYFNAILNIFGGSHFDVLLCEEYVKDIPSNLVSVCNFIPVPARAKIARAASCVTGILHRYHKAALKLIGKNNYTYIFFDHNALAGSLISKVPLMCTSIVLHHNYEYNYYRDNTTSFLRRLLILPQVRRNERRAFEMATYNLFLTSQDMKEFESTYKVWRGKNKVTGIFEPANLPPPLRKINKQINKARSLVITGSLSEGNIQNKDAITYFINELYPIAKENKITIAGKSPSSYIQDLISPYSGIHLIPSPQNMEDVVSSADIYVCPCRLGSGIKVRISDGLRSGLPVIAHEISARGYDEYEERGYLYRFDSALGFRNCVTEVVNQLEAGLLTKEEISNYYNKHNSLSGGIAKIRRALDL